MAGAINGLIKGRVNDAVASNMPNAAKNPKCKDRRKPIIKQVKAVMFKIKPTPSEVEIASHSAEKGLNIKSATAPAAAIFPSVGLSAKYKKQAANKNVVISNL